MSLLDLLLMTGVFAMIGSVYILRKRKKGTPRVSDSFCEFPVHPVAVRAVANIAEEREIDRRFEVVHRRARERNAQIGATYREMERLRTGRANDER